MLPRHLQLRAGCGFYLKKILKLQEHGLLPVKNGQLNYISLPFNQRTQGFGRRAQVVRQGQLFLGLFSPAPTLLFRSNAEGWGCSREANKSLCPVTTKNTGMGFCYWCLIGQIQKSVVLVVKTCQKNPQWCCQPPRANHCHLPELPLLFILLFFLVGCYPGMGSFPCWCLFGVVCLCFAVL